jgi:ribose/xylose/arabinose/galactoside ABC-type transport system permease subunit
MDPDHLRLAVLAALVLLVALAFAIYTPTFLSSGNLRGMARDMAVLAIVALGATFVIIAGEIDLSVGSIVALVSLILALVLSDGMPTPLALLLALGVGAAAGAVNGLLTLHLKIPSFLATLGILSIAQGAAIALSAQPVPVPTGSFTRLFGGDVAGVPLGLLYAVAFAALSFVVLRSTRFGMRTRAVGSDDAAARMIGLDPTRTKYLVFVVAGLASAIGAILFVGRTGYGLALSSTDLLLDVLAAVMLGGSRLGGGKGSVVGTVLGAALITVALSGISGLGVDPGYQQIAKGAVIGLVVLFMRR